MVVARSQPGECPGVGSNILAASVNPIAPSSSFLSRQHAVCLGDRVFLMSPSPGRIREEFTIPLARPRDINSPELAAIAQRITLALRSHLVESREAAE